MKSLKGQRHRTLELIVVGSLIVSVLLVASSGIFTSNNPCGSCHRRHYEYCTLLPNDAASYLPQEFGITPITIKMAIEISGNSRNRYYEIEELRVTLKSTKGNLVIEAPEQKIHNLFPGDKAVLSWEVTGTKHGSDTLEFLLSARNPHRNSRFTDYYSYNANVQETGSPDKPSAIDPSTWTLLLEKDINQELSLYVNRDVNNIQISDFQGVSITPKRISHASKGDELRITFTLLEDREMNGDVAISWNEENIGDEITIYLSYIPLLEDTSEYYTLVGRITGMTLFIFLIASMILGGVIKRVIDPLNWRMGKRKRIRIHCWISWFLFALSLFHGFILLIRPYNEFFWDYKVILGDLTCLSILLVSLNGSFMKQIIKIGGHNLWRRMHQLFSWSALTLLVIHATLIGTDFASIRDLVGL